MRAFNADQTEAVKRLSQSADFEIFLAWLADAGDIAKTNAINPDAPDRTHIAGQAYFADQVELRVREVWTQRNRANAQTRVHQ